MISTPALDALLIGADLVITFAVLKASLITGAAALAALILGRREPALRAVVWSGAFVALVLAPATAFIAPAWTAQLVAFPVQLWRTGVNGAPADVAQGMPPVAVWLFGVWGAVTLVRLVRIVRDIAAARALVRRSEPVADRRFAAALREACARLGVGREVRIAISDRIAGPVTLGWLRPVILLPAGTAGWPPDRLRSVLLHEVAHVRRADWPVMITAELIRALHWFNPLVGWMVRHLRAEQDRACDRAAVRFGGVAPADYARHLVDVARTLRPAPRPPLAALPLVGRSGLEHRVRAVLRPARSSSTLGFVAAALLAGLLGVGFGGAQLWRCDASDTPPASDATEPRG